MIKAIETEYDGYRFRSRLEARWAVFFNTLGIKYEYEKEGYDLDGTWYLPDFWLPELDCWVEIKGEKPTEEENEKVEKLAYITGKDCLLVYGNVGLGEYRIIHFEFCDREDIVCGKEGGDFDIAVENIGHEVWQKAFDYFSFCRRCPRFAIANYECEFVEFGTSDERCYTDKIPYEGHDRLLAAYKAARSARFEHREKP